MNCKPKRNRNNDDRHDNRNDLRFQLATGQLQNTMQITAVKRDIARAKTILRLKEQA